jgi:hypothetical protein
MVCAAAVLDHGAHQEEKMHIGLKLVKIAALYMVGGLLMGLAMGISGNFTLSSVHAHILMLGWATMALSGIVCLVMPGIARRVCHQRGQEWQA